MSVLEDSQRQVRVETNTQRHKGAISTQVQESGQRIKMAEEELKWHLQNQDGLHKNKTAPT